MAFTVDRRFVPTGAVVSHVRVTVLCNQLV